MENTKTNRVILRIPEETLEAFEQTTLDEFLWQQEFKRKKFFCSVYRDKALEWKFNY